MAALAAFFCFAILCMIVQAAHSPLPLITPAPRYPPLAQLRQRSLSLDTCGYVSGNSNNPLTCPTSFSCANIGDSGLGCCNQVNCASSGGATICGDRENASCQGDNYDFCTSYYGDQLLLCTDQTAPACATYLRVPPSDGDVTRTSYSCATSETSILFLVGTTNTNQAVATSAAASSNEFAGLLPSSTSPLNFLGTTQNSLSSPTSNPSTSTSGSNNKPILSQGTIIAIAVGGAVILIVAAFLGRYVYKNCGSRSSQRPSMRDDGSSAWAQSQWAGSQYGGPPKPATEAWVMENRNLMGGHSDYGDVGGGRGGWR